MRKFYFLVLGLLVFSAVKAQIVTIPNSNFKKLLLSAGPNNTIAKNISGGYFKIDANNDGEIQISEAQNVTELSFSDTVVDIASIVGITSFSNLIGLYCPGNRISSIDLKGLTSLKGLNCSSNLLTSLNLQGLVNLTDLICE